MRQRLLFTFQLPIALIFLSGLVGAQAEETTHLPETGLGIADVWCLNSAGEKRPDAGCFIHDQVVMRLTGLKKWAQTEGNDPEKLQLVLNGVMLRDVYGRIDRGELLRFNLTDVQSNPEEGESQWRTLLSRSTITKPKSVSVGITVADGKERVFWPGTLKMRVTSKAIFVSVVVLYVVLFIGFCVLARMSDIIRAPGPKPANGNRPYSLARTQMAAWFFVIVGAYIYIGVVTGDLNSLTAGVLGLAGISAGTGLAAVAIDSGKSAESATKRQSRLANRASALAKVANLKDQVVAAGAAATAELKAELKDEEAKLAEAQSQLDATPAPAAPTSRQWWILDLISDGPSVSFHRFQIVVWTVVLGGFFLRSVWYDLTMPEFDATLLGLMGLSSGTYVGFKIPTQDAT